MPSSEAARTDHITLRGSLEHLTLGALSLARDGHRFIPAAPEPLSRMRMRLHKRKPETNDIALTKPRNKHWQNRGMKGGVINIWEIQDYINNVIQCKSPKVTEPYEGRIAAKKAIRRRPWRQT